MGEIRIVGPGKTRGYPYPQCKKSCSVSDYTTGSKLYDRFYRHRLSDYQMEQFNIPTPQPGKEGVIKPFKDTHNFTPGNLFLI